MKIKSIEDLGEIADIDCEFLALRGRLGRAYCAKRNVFLEQEPCAYNCEYFIQRLNNCTPFIAYESIEAEREEE
jgi:hypothetical protein